MFRERNVSNTFLSENYFCAQLHGKKDGKWKEETEMKSYAYVTYWIRNVQAKFVILINCNNYLKFSCHFVPVCFAKYNGRKKKKKKLTEKNLILGNKSSLFLKRYYCLACFNTIYDFSYILNSDQSSVRVKTDASNFQITM